MGQRYPLPITALMVHPANPNCAKPAYWGAGATADWSVGAAGNDIDIATRTEPVTGAHATGVTITPYPIRTQLAKGAAMVPPMQPLADLGKDYGDYAGETGRDGWTEPFMPYGPEPEA